jgi:lipopolysaccharide assembly outer membrane protein LptD (OstA)
MMVINQRSYNEIGPYERMPKSKYNYYPNYVSRNKTKANFNIGGELIRVDNKNYKLLLSYEGENINLLTPERLPTEIVFDLETTRSGKYLDFMIQSTKIKGFVFQQLAF